ncbi:hypothetical protein ACWDSJ_20790 [Nocardia sp. NPDC003482]|uniref:hypothetical protein n=1 Tax=Nocardia sp. NPDC004068 TaxID=3364303 RepID=UPI0036A389DF
MQSQEKADLRADVAALSQAVEDGTLWIDGVHVTEGTHERCAQRYEELAERIESQLGGLRAAVSLPGFGGFESGNALRRGFESKAAEALQRLQEYADAARQFADTLRAAGAVYARHDSDAATALGRIGAQTVGVGHA